MTKDELINYQYFEAVKGFKEEWFLDDKWYQHITSLPIEQRVTYLVVVLHNQITNGGLEQYYQNRYGQFVIETIDALMNIGAVNKATILKKSYEVVNPQNLTYQKFRKELRNAENPIVFVDKYFRISTKTAEDQLQKFTKAFWELDEVEDTVELLGSYLFNFQH